MLNVKQREKSETFAYSPIFLALLTWALLVHYSNKTNCEAAQQKLQKDVHI